MWNVLAEVLRDENFRCTAGMIECVFNPSNSNARFPVGHPAYGQLMWRPLAPGLEFQRLCKKSFSFKLDERGAVIRVNGIMQWELNPEYRYWIIVPQGLEGVMMCQDLLAEYRAAVAAAATQDTAG